MFNQIVMQKTFLYLERHFGTQTKVAKALGYTTRHYRGIRSGGSKAPEWARVSVKNLAKLIKLQARQDKINDILK